MKSPPNRLLARISAVWLSLFVVLCRSSGKADRDDRIYTDAAINGKTVRLVFYTGGNQLLLIPEGAKQLNLKWKNLILPGNGALPPELFCDLQVWGTTQKVPWYLWNSSVPSFPSNKCAGLIPWTLLRTNNFKIDAISKKVSLLKKVKANSGRVFDIDPADKYLVINVGVPETKSLKVHLDTSSALGVKLAPAGWRTWRETHINQPSTPFAIISSNGRPIIYDLCWASEIVVGGLRLTEVPVCEVPSNLLPREDAVLGRAALRRIKIEVDGKQNKAHLSLRTGRVPQFIHNRLGALFVPDVKEARVLRAHVAAPSPASRADIRDNDILLQLNGVDVNSLPVKPGVLPLTEFWEQSPGTELRLTLKRGDDIIDRKAVLEQILPPPKN
jgi:hypothetical protein